MSSPDSSPVAISRTPLANVLTAWWDASQRIRIRSVPPGLSGGSVWRIDQVDSGESFALKSCDRSRASHLTGIDTVIAHAAERCEHLTPVLPTRRGQLGTASRDHWWRCFRWRCGEPMTDQSNTATVAEGVTALARAHEALNHATQTDASSSGAPTQPRSPDRVWLRQRRDFLAAIPHRLNDPIELSTIARPLADAIMDARECLERARTSGTLAAVTEQLRQWDANTLAQRAPLSHGDTHTHGDSWTFGDAHPDNVLFDPNLGSIHGIGLIDHDEARLADPACDVARFIGGLRADFFDADSVIDTIAWAAAEYRRIRPFSDCQQRLAAIWMAAGWIGSLANWVIWVSQEKRFFAWTPELLADRIHTLAGHVCQLESNRWRQFDTLRD